MNSILKDIENENPIGIDARYEDDYLSLELELDKSLSVSNIGDTNWSFVIEKTEEMLSFKTKDLKLLSYWLYANWKVDNWNGLISNAPIYNEFLVKYGKKVYPKSQKVKLRTLEWMAENLTSQIINSYNSDKKKELKTLIREFEKIENTLSKLFEIEITYFNAFIRKMKNKLEEKVSTIKTDTTNVKKEEKKESIKTNQENKKEILKKTDVLKKYKAPVYIDDLKSILEKNKKIESFDSSIMLVTITNLEFIFVLENNLIEIAEDFYFQEDLTKKIEGASLEELFFILEKNPLFLDVYHKILEHSESKKFNCNIIKYNLIYTLDLCDDKQKKKFLKSKFISNKTMHWLDGFIINDDIYSKKYKEALKLLTLGKKQESIDLLDNLDRNSSSIEESFLWRLQMVKLSMEMGNKDFSLALLLNLEEQINYYNLDSWNPTLATQVYQFLLKPALNKKITLEKKELIYTNLCNISPKKALNNEFL